MNGKFAVLLSAVGGSLAALVHTMTTAMQFFGAMASMLVGFYGLWKIFYGKAEKVQA